MLRWPREMGPEAFRWKNNDPSKPSVVVSYCVCAVREMKNILEEKEGFSPSFLVLLIQFIMPSIPLQRTSNS